MSLDGNHETPQEPVPAAIRIKPSVPGPAEAGLLFSMMAFLQLYAGRWIAVPGLSDTARILLAEVGFIALPPLLFALFARYRLADTFRLRLPGWRDTGLVVLMAPIATLAAYSAGLLAIALVRLAFGTMRISGDIGDIMSRGLPVAVLTMGVVPAVCEEWMFRGFFQRGMEGFGERRAVLVSGVLFGLFHFDFQRFAAQTLLGLVIAYVVYRSGSLFGGMLLHFLHNAGSVLLAGLSGGLGLITLPQAVVEGGSLLLPMQAALAFLAAPVSGDVFSMPVIMEYAQQAGMSMDDLVRALAAGSGILLAACLIVMAGLLVAFRHLTRHVEHRARPPAPGRAFLTAIPGLLLILAVYAAIALDLLGHPAAEKLMKLL